MRVPFFAGHIKYLTERFDSNVADVRIPFNRQLGRYKRLLSVDTDLLIRSMKAVIEKLVMATFQKGLIRT